MCMYVYVCVCACMYMCEWVLDETNCLYIPICKAIQFELQPRVDHKLNPVTTPSAQDPLLQVQT